MNIKLQTLCHSFSGAVCAGAVLLMASSAPAENRFVDDHRGRDFRCAPPFDSGLGQNLFVTSAFPLPTIVEITPDRVQSVIYSPSYGVGGLAFDSAGDLFTLTFEGYYGTGGVIEITPGGEQRTVVASGLFYPSSLAINSAGDLFVGDYEIGTITKITPAGVQSIFASESIGLDEMAFDSAGNLFVSFYGNGFILDSGYIIEITPDGVQSTFASGINNPIGLAFNSAGDLFVSADDDKVYKLTPAGVRSIFASGLGYATGLAFNKAGDLFVADRSENNAIYEITPAGVKSTFASGMDLNGVFDLAFQPVPCRRFPAIYDNSTPVTGNWVTFGYGAAVVDGAETTATYGQTFTAPSVRPSDKWTYLDEWTFYLQQIPLDLGGLGTEQNFEFFVMAWDGINGTATGPILYHSDRQTVAADTTSYTPFTVHPEDLALTPGSQYVIFINVSLRRNDNNPLGSSLELAGNGSGGVFPPPISTSPLGGQFVYQYTVGEFKTIEELGAAVATQGWATWAVDEYAAYHAVFSDAESHRHHH